MSEDRVFNPPPGWPVPPVGWVPPRGWKPDSAWPPAPEGWQLWLCSDGKGVEVAVDAGTEQQPESCQSSQQLDDLRAENESLRARLAAQQGGTPTVPLDDEAILQDIGIYCYHHPLEHAVNFKERLDLIGRKISETVKSSRAIQASNMFTFDNSLAKGRKMTSDLSKLMLRAYNAEVDNSVRSLRVGNIVTAKKRVERSRDAIAKLGRMMELHISDEFHALRVEELELTSDYLMKKQEEREAAREERARLREERRVQAELAAERERLDKERNHIQNALEALRVSGNQDAELVARLAAIDGAIEKNDFRAANVRAGYVYVISNRGAFGEGVVKIGLTRRLEPLERISELSGAAVPFRFDVHALFFSEDAVSLEAELHQHFSSCRVNCANVRKEFFFATPREVREVLVSKVGNLLEFVDEAESVEYNQSLKYWSSSRD